METFDPRSLTEEKSLAQIAWRSRRLPPNWFNRIVLLLVTAVVATFAISSTRPAKEFASDARDIASFGLAFASQILGFLLAGFTIFATMNKPGLFQRLAVAIEKRSGLSYLKYNFFAFVEVFVFYLGFSAASAAVLVFGRPGGLISELLRSDGGPDAPQVAARVTWSVMVVWLAYLFLLLKSFIFNIYHVVMTAIRWDFVAGRDDAALRDDSPGSVPPNIG